MQVRTEPSKTEDIALVCVNIESCKPWLPAIPFLRSASASTANLELELELLLRSPLTATLIHTRTPQGTRKAIPAQLWLASESFCCALSLTPTEIAHYKEVPA